MKANYELKRLKARIEDRSVPEDEPLFILRAQDQLAPAVIRRWAELAYNYGSPAAKIEEALSVAKQMEKWPVQRIPGTTFTMENPPKNVVDQSKCKHNFRDVSLFGPAPGKTNLRCRICDKFVSVKTGGWKFKRLARKYKVGP